MENFIDGQSVVHGKQFMVSPKIISHLSSLENKGINFSETTNISYQKMVELFHREGEPQPLLTISTRGKNKGFQ